MAGLIYADRVAETTTTTGTGTLSLGGAWTGGGPTGGYQPFSSACVNDQTVYYAITDGTNWEVGRGTFLSGTDQLTRDVLLSSSTGSFISFGAGTKIVWLDQPAASIADISLTSSFAMRLVPQ